MIDDIVFAIGLVAVLEGLALALAPRWLEGTLRKISELSVEARKLMGLGLVAIGVLIVWIAKYLLV